MSITPQARWHNVVHSMAILVAVCVVVFSQSHTARGQDVVVVNDNFRRPTVGGIHVDAAGVVSSPRIEDAAALEAVRQEALNAVPGDMKEFTPLRMVSLRRLEEEVARHREGGEGSLPDEVTYLAGLQRVQYVFVVPEENDVVLAGPAEGWRADRLGNIVGITTGRPVLTLDDLMVALRTRSTSNASGMSCSIDPTPAGIARVNQLRLDPNPQKSARMMEWALGPQIITITGVPETSQFARAMVAADFRMKRIAMALEDAPIPGMPSYMQMARPGRAGATNSMPRWWLAPDYEPLRTDREGLSWEIRGQGVKCMTAEDYVSETGEIKRGAGRVNAAAQRWAEMMTDKYDELAAADSSFGYLRNIMDLAVVAALIEKEGLLERAGVQLPNLSDDETVYHYDAPRTVATQASFIKNRGKWIVSASGGVQIYPWQIANRTEQSDTLAPVRAQATRSSDGWWWN